MTMFLNALVCLLCANLFSVGADYMYPVLTEEPQDGFGFEDQPLTLRCRATGNPPPVITWLKDNKEMTITGTNKKKTKEGDLIIEKFNPVDDVGNYKCQVSVSDSTLQLTLVSRVANIKRAGTYLVKSFPTSFPAHVVSFLYRDGESRRLDIKVFISPFPR